MGSKKKGNFWGLAIVAVVLVGGGFATYQAWPSDEGTTIIRTAKVHAAPSPAP